MGDEKKRTLTYHVNNSISIVLKLLFIFVEQWKRNAN